MEPISLKGTHVHLVPLSVSDAEQLWEAAQDTDPFEFMPLPFRVDGVEPMRRLIEGVLAADNRLVFAQRVDGRAIGTTGFWSHDLQHSSLEIGFSWLTRRLQRTGANTEAKLMMLQHAFGALGCMRVEFKTDSRNTKSRTALEGIGATQEGILRSHRQMLQGPRRDSVYYSILRDEWPAVESRLRERLARHG